MRTEGARPPEQRGPLELYYQPWVDQGGAGVGEGHAWQCFPFTFPQESECSLQSAEEESQPLP